MQVRLLRPFWARLFQTDFRFLVIIFIILGAIRMVGLVRHELYIVVAGFLIMWALPLLFYHRAGRRQTGLV
jgi:hypothetical protein